jgi:hypothetical protein
MGRGPFFGNSRKMRGFPMNLSPGGLDEAPPGFPYFTTADGKFEFGYGGPAGFHHEFFPGHHPHQGPPGQPLPFNTPGEKRGQYHVRKFRLTAELLLLHCVHNAAASSLDKYRQVKSSWIEADLEKSAVIHFELLRVSFKLTWAWRLYHIESLRPTCQLLCSGTRRKGHRVLLHPFSAAWSMQRHRPGQCCRSLDWDSNLRPEHKRTYTPTFGLHEPH